MNFQPKDDNPEAVKEFQAIAKWLVATHERGYLVNVALYSVLEERTLKELWSKLHTLYIGKNICNKLMLKKRLYNLWM